jgi:hypothetical protein
VYVSARTAEWRRSRGETRISPELGGWPLMAEHTRPARGMRDFLPDDVRQGARPQPVGQWASRVLVEQGQRLCFVLHGRVLDSGPPVAGVDSGRVLISR